MTPTPWEEEWVDIELTKATEAVPVAIEHEVFGAPNTTAEIPRDQLDALVRACRPLHPRVVRRYTSAMFCEHANEVPMGCPCRPDCYCRHEGSCRR